MNAVVSELNTTLTLGGFIATVVALALGILAYILSRKSQLDSRKEALKNTAQPDGAAAGGGADANADENTLEERVKVHDASTKPFRWD